MYGTLHAYAICDDKLENVLTSILNADGNEKHIQDALNADCTIGFDILDMTLKQRANHETDDIKLDIYEFSNIETSLREAQNINISDAAKIIKQESKVACM